MIIMQSCLPVVLLKFQYIDLFLLISNQICILLVFKWKLHAQQVWLLEWVWFNYRSPPQLKFMNSWGNVHTSLHGFLASSKMSLKDIALEGLEQGTIQGLKITRVRGVS